MKSLAARDPNNAEWQNDLAGSYDHVGNIREARGDRDGALDAYENCLAIMKSLAARDPNNTEWQRDMAVGYNKLADLARKSGDENKAKQSYERVIAIMRGLAEKDPSNAGWQADIAENILKLALVDEPKVQDHLQEGFSILGRLRTGGKLSFRTPRPVPAAAFQSSSERRKNRPLG